MCSEGSTSRLHRDGRKEQRREIVRGCLSGAAFWVSLNHFLFSRAGWRFLFLPPSPQRVHLSNTEPRTDRGALVPSSLSRASRKNALFAPNQVASIPPTFFSPSPRLLVRAEKQRELYGKESEKGREEEQKIKGMKEKRGPRATSASTPA